MSKRRQEINRPWWPVAERLRRARIYAGLEGQGDIAALLSVTRAQVNKWESGTVRVPKTVLLSYAHVTGFDVAWLENGDAEGVVLPATRETLRGRESNSQPTDRESRRPAPRHRVAAPEAA